MIITAYFAGFAINGLFFTIPDRIGRKMSVFYAMVASCLAQTVMIFSSSFYVRSAMFFVMGLTQLKVGASFVWLSECVGHEYKSTAFTLINMYDAITMAVTCAYFIFISRELVWLCLFFCVLSYVATLVVLVSCCSVLVAHYPVLNQT